MAQATPHNPYVLPDNLPVPFDDGAADHLIGKSIPSLFLESSDGAVDLAALAASRVVIYIYPRTGTPGVDSPEGWDQIPGARGCTPQSCSFRDHVADLAQFGAKVAGLSAQTLPEQIAFAERNHIPYPVIADPRLRLAEELNLPTFEVASMTLYKRLTLVAEKAEIVKVFYPVFPPDANAEEVLDWLSENRK